MDNFDLFLRLMDEKRYEGLVFGEISAMTQFNRVGKTVANDACARGSARTLVNGSDYPLPAVNPYSNAAAREAGLHHPAGRRIVSKRSTTTIHCYSISFSNAP